ncbi:MAG TPA: aminoacyl-tRNA hydrolase [Bauldia sp.]|nr:aminoacyl-tRNA hydrolase [Bauldia sp.]
MLLVVGLGNPGPEYARQRHNVGFIAVDAIHRRHGFQPWRRRFSGEIAEGTLSGEKALLLKPLTYMNDSGRSVQEAAHFYKLEPKDIVVIHDEVDLPPGKTRMKVGGGAAGHNGLRSIDAAIGQDYRRLRIGVGHPGVKEAVPGYVLHDFPKIDAEWLVPLIDTIAENAPLLAKGQDNTFANRLHAAANPAGEAPVPTKGAPAATPKATPASAEPDKPQGPFAGLKKLFGG